MWTRSRWRQAWVVAALLSVAAGWRSDGGDAARDADPPTRLDASTRVWSTPLPGWANGSPVLVGGELLVTAEPTWLIALDAQTGRERWRARLDREDALPEAERVAYERLVATLPSLHQALDHARTDLGAARALAQQDPTSSEAQDRMRTIGAAISTLDLRIAAVERQVGVDAPALIGLATPTPASDGQTIVALFGNGVVGAWSVDGNRKWMRALEPAPVAMRGFDTGMTASPVIVDGLAIVPAGRLVGLDLETGQTVWTGAPWRDFGSPTAMKVGALSMLLTPDGHVLRASDGAELDSGLADLWYTGAIVDGDRAYWVGSMGDGRRHDSAWATAWQIKPTETGVSATRLWTEPLGMSGAVYASCATDGEALYVVDQQGHLVTLRADTGEAIRSQELGGELAGTVYASPVLTRDHVLLASEAGTLVFADRGAAAQPVVKASLGDTFRSTALAVGPDLYVRRRLTVERYTRR